MLKHLQIYAKMRLHFISKIVICSEIVCGEFIYKVCALNAKQGTNLACFLQASTCFEETHSVKDKLCLGLHSFSYCKQTLALWQASEESACFLLSFFCDD